MVTFKKVTWDNWEACIKLSVTKEQETFVAPIMYTLSQSYVAETNDPYPPLSYAIYNEKDQLVGHIYMYYELAKDNIYDDDNSYQFCRLLIDKKYQNQGYGKASVKKALEIIRSFPYGPATYAYISYEPENVLAKKLYASFGFEETGDIDETELVARVRL